MALYFPNLLPSTGQKAGESFGGGIGNALNLLAQQKMNQLQQRQHMAKVSGALESLGIPAQVSQLPENIQQAFIKQHLAAPQQQAYAEALSNILGGGQTNQEQILPEKNVSPTQQALNKMPQQATVIPKGLNQQQATQLAQLGLKKASQEEAMQFKKGEVRRKYVDELVKEKKANEDKLQALKVMEQLNNDPKALDSSVYLRALKAFGIDNIGALLKPGTQQFKAAEVAFLTNLKTIFGARPTNFDVMTYLSKLPNLMQSPEGRRRVIENWKNLLGAAQTRYDITRDVLKQYPSGVPADISLMVEEKAAPLIEKALTKFEQEANDIVSGASSFKVGQSITKDKLSSLPAGTVLEENGKKFIWDGSKKKAFK